MPTAAKIWSWMDESRDPKQVVEREYSLGIPGVVTSC